MANEKPSQAAQATTSQNTNGAPTQTGQRTDGQKEGATTDDTPLNAERVSISDIK